MVPQVALQMGSRVGNSRDSFPLVISLEICALVFTLNKVRARWEIYSVLQADQGACKPSLLTWPAAWQHRQWEQSHPRGTVRETESEGRDLENSHLTNLSLHGHNGTLLGLGSMKQWASIGHKTHSEGQLHPNPSGSPSALSVCSCYTQCMCNRLFVLILFLPSLPHYFTTAPDFQWVQGGFSLWKCWVICHGILLLKYAAALLLLVI